MEYLNNFKFEKFSPVLEDCANWFSQISLALAYPENDAQIDKVTPPVSFKEWFDEVREDESLDETVIADINNVYSDMIKAGNEVVEKLQSNEKPDFDEFNDFKGLYNGFVSRLRWLEKGSLISGSGICPETGLRSKDAIVQDQKKEMERLKRQGTSFSLVMVRVDNFSNYEKERALELSVNSIKICMRSFDDGYYLGAGYFLLSLKQTDIIGAEAATDRLQIIIGEQRNDDEDIGLSYCIAEPVEDDELDKLLDYMRDDLLDHNDEKNVSLKYIAQSPLQKYVDKLKQETA